MFDPFFPIILLGVALALLALIWIQRHLKASSLPRTTSIAMIAALWLLFMTGVGYSAWPLLFLGANDPRTSMYVQVPEGVAPGAFHVRLSSILQKQGFHPDSASISSPEDPENPMLVLEAQGVFTRVWSQTQPLSREEAVACGYLLSKEDYAANDERQYNIAVTSIPLFPGRAQATFTAVKEQLLRSGYGVSPQPLPCQPTA